MPHFGWCGRGNWFVWSLEDPDPTLPSLCIPIIENSHAFGSDDLCLCRLVSLDVAKPVVTRRAVVVQLGAAAIDGERFAMVPTAGYLHFAERAPAGVFESCPDLPPVMPASLSLPHARRAIAQVRAMFTAAGRIVPSQPPTGVTEVDHRAALEREAAQTRFLAWVLLQMGTLAARSGGQWRLSLSTKPVGALPSEVVQDRERARRTVGVQQVLDAARHGHRVHSVSALCDAMTTSVGRTVSAALAEVTSFLEVAEGTGPDDEADRVAGNTYLPDPIAVHTSIGEVTVEAHAALVRVLGVLFATHRSLQLLRVQAAVRLAPFVPCEDWAAVEKDIIWGECVAGHLEVLVTAALGTDSPQLCPGDRRRLCAALRRTVAYVMWLQDIK